MMDDLVVGEGELDLNELARYIERSESFSSLLRQWKRFGECLGLDDTKLLELERNLNIDRLHIKSVPREALKIWKAYKGTSATLQDVFDSLNDCGVKAITEFLQTTFVSPKHLRILKFEWQGKVATLKDLLGESAPINIYENIYDELKQCGFIKSSKLIKNEVINPKLLPYYCNRIFDLTSREKHLRYSRRQERELLSSFFNTCRQRFRPLLITGSPVSGKTEVIKYLITNFEASTDTCFYIILPEIIQELHLLRDCQSLSALDAVASFAARDKISQIVLLEILKRSNSYKFNMFLDGYDQLRKDNLDVVDAFLKQLQKIENIRIFITTTHPLQSRLCTVLNYPFSWRILPMDDSSQTDLLIKYWCTQRGVNPNQSLKEYAQKCLARIPKKEQEIEVPLKCMMLAEIFAEDAYKAAKTGMITKDAIPHMSTFAIYRTFIDLKLEKTTDLTLKAHWYVAIVLLFPDRIQSFEPILGKHDSIDWDVINLIGLMERSSTTRGKFIHQTIAEFMFADFIVKNISKESACVDLLLSEVLGRKGTAEVQGTCSGQHYYELKYDRVAYFLEIHFQQYANEGLLQHLSFKQFLTSAAFSSEDICVAVSACCYMNLEHTFDYLIKVLGQFRIEKELQDRYFRYLPYTVVERTKNISMLRKLLEFTKEKFEMDVSYHAYKNENLNIPNCSPFHLASSLGKHEFITTLMDMYEENTRELGYYQSQLHKAYTYGLLSIGVLIFLLSAMLVINYNSCFQDDKICKHKVPENDDFISSLQFLEPNIDDNEGKHKDSIQRIICSFIDTFTEMNATEILKNLDNRMVEYFYTAGLNLNMLQQLLPQVYKIKLIHKATGFFHLTVLFLLIMIHLQLNCGLDIDFITGVTLLFTSVVAVVLAAITCYETIHYGLNIGLVPTACFVFFIVVQKRSVAISKIRLLGVHFILSVVLTVLLFDEALMACKYWCRFLPFIEFLSDSPLRYWF